MKHGFSRQIPPALLVWILAGLVSGVSIFYRTELPWLVNYPEAWVLPVIEWANTGMDWFVENFRWFFRSISWLLSWAMSGALAVLVWLPWAAAIVLFMGVALIAGGWSLAVFTVAALMYMVVIGYWEESMRTLALVSVSVPLSVIVGFGMGVAALRSPRTNRVVQPALDLMQTVPTFAYLVPILLLFGFGPVVGLIASSIYACPPMVRNTMLALSRVPEEVVESGKMSGATERQLFWWVRFPTALPTIMIGVNQTTMAALSMVIIAAIIGSSADIGWEVLSTMRRANFGESLLAGIVIALIAMVLDRITRAFATRDSRKRKYLSGVSNLQTLVGTLFVTAFFIIAAQLYPELNDYPDDWVFYPAGYLNDIVAFVTVEFSGILEAIKNGFLFFLLLPLRIGLENTIRPFTWGFTLTPVISGGYAVMTMLLAAFLGVRYSWRVSVGILLVCSILFFGFEHSPWPMIIILIVVLAWQVGGLWIGILTLSGLGFMLVTGVWVPAMRSLYLCLAAVLCSFLIGCLLGILASQNNRLSGILRPIIDTLQTMPLFVLLIPVLMFFQVGEFTAFLAIIAYAIVPAIRYTEHGLRHVDPEVVEAARSMGCTERQLLWEVRLPLAIPEIMLGLNQTIMFALAMLVIAALVGTRGLGQSIYIALSKADFGLGLVAGLSMALIAIIADRVLHAYSRRQRQALGLQ